MSTRQYRFCENCGTRNAPTGKFCSQCGEPLDPPAQITIPTYRSPNHEKLQSRGISKSSLVITTLSLLVVILVVVVLVLQFSRNTSAPSPAPSLAPSSAPSSSPVTVNCNERKQTGVGNTAMYSFTVRNGCVAVVTGVNVTGIPNPWSDGGGGIEGLQPGSYTVTILDGSYQIGTTTAGPAMWCNIYKWEQQNGKADTYNYPIDGWSSNCP